MFSVKVTTFVVIANDLSTQKEKNWHSYLNCKLSIYAYGLLVDRQRLDLISNLMLLRNFVTANDPVELWYQSKKNWSRNSYFTHTSQKANAKINEYWHAICPMYSSFRAVYRQTK